MTLTTTYADNKTAQATPTDVGIKIAKPGYNVNTAAGENLVYSSSWPVLQYPFEDTFSNPGTISTTGITIPHGLNYAPLAFGWFIGPDPSGVGTTASRIPLPTDKKNIYISTSLQNITLTQQSIMINSAQINVKAFNVDLTVDIDYTLAAAPTTNTTYDPNYGIKVAKEGKSAFSSDLRDFVLHSRCQSPLVLAVKTQKTMAAANSGAAIQYNTKLTYPSWIYGFAQNSNGIYIPAPYYAQAYPQTTTDGFTSYIQTSSVGGFNNITLVILRDPMFAPTQTVAQY